MSKIDSKDLLNLVFEVGLLKKVVRTGWVKKGVKDPESVADHTWRVSVLAMLLAPQLGVNQLKLVKMALVHDLGEALIGDIVWEKGKKVIGSQEEKHKDEKKAVKNMFSDNPSFSEYVELWEEFERQETKEAKMVKLIDKLEMAIQAFEYESEGYKDLDEFWENVEKYLKGSELEEYFRELKKLRTKK